MTLSDWLSDPWLMLVLLVVWVTIDLDQARLSLFFDQEPLKRVLLGQVSTPESLGDASEGVVLSEHDI